MKLLTSLRVLLMFARLMGRVPTRHLWYLFRRMRNEKPHRFAGQVRINTFFPPWPSEAFDRFCRAVIDRRRVPFSTYLAVTHACPYQCEHCSYAGRKPANLSGESILDIIAQIKALGTCTLGFTGGEPLLRDDLEDFIAAAGPEMATIVFTTGAGLDAKRAKSLAAAGVTCVTVGVESSDPAEHDAVRGAAGSFDQARAAVAACNEADVYTAISTIGTREKIVGGELERLYELADDWGAREFRVLFPVATGGLAGCADFMLTPQELRALAEFHIRCNRRSSGPAVACFAYMESAEMFGCGAGYHHLFIDAAGSVCPCDLTPLAFGNVTAEPLADIWRRMERYFPLPRRKCLMYELAGRINTSDLPLPRKISEQICPACRPDDTLPEVYRRLLRR